MATVDQTQVNAADYMAWIQKRFGSEITTRTWKTVTKILSRLPDN